MNCSKPQFFFPVKKQLLFITLGSNISLTWQVKELGNHQLHLIKFISNFFELGTIKVLSYAMDNG